MVMVQGRVWVRLYKRTKNKWKLVKVKFSRRLGGCYPRDSGMGQRALQTGHKIRGRVLKGSFSGSVRVFRAQA